MSFIGKIKHNKKWWGIVEHRSKYGRFCCGSLCYLCLGNMMHSKIKEYMWHIDEWEEQPTINHRNRISIRKLSGFPHKKKHFKSDW